MMNKQNKADSKVIKLYFYKKIFTFAYVSTNTLKVGIKNKHTQNYYKLLKTKSNNFNYPHIVVIHKFLKSPDPNHLELFQQAVIRRPVSLPIFH